MAGLLQNELPPLPDINVVKDICRDQLKLHLETFFGQKDLVLDAELMKVLDRVAGATFLKNHGVEKIYRLESKINQQGCEKRLYITRANLVLMRYIAEHINADKSAGIVRTYKILMVPRKVYSCEYVLEQEGVLGYLEMDELTVDLVPLDKDLLSLENHNFFTSFYLNGDQTSVHTIARSLLSLQQIYGAIPTFYGVGRCAKMVHELMSRMLTADPNNEPAHLKYEIGQAFLIDRDIDYVTPLATQVTYEGLLDDVFGIKCGVLELGADVTGAEHSTKLILSGQDTIFEDIRDKHFSTVSNFLSTKAKELQTGYDKRHFVTTVSEMKSFVSHDLKDLKQQHKSLALHIAACEAIMKRKATADFEDQLKTEHSMLEGSDTRENIALIEELMNRQCSEWICIRLLALLSLTQGGLANTTAKSLKTQFIHAFGYDWLIGFHNLKRLNIWQEQESSQQPLSFSRLADAAANIARTSPFRLLAKKLRLIPKSAEEINLRNPNDMSYVFSGAYTPLTCKLISEVISRRGFTGLEDVMKLIPNQNFCSTKATSVRNKSIDGSVGKQADNVVLVYFIGGCTYAEIAALRFLGKLKGYQFIIATTAIINGESFLRQISERG